MNCPLKTKALLATVALMGGIAVVFMFVSCATIMHGTSQEIGFSSTPPGADVQIDDHGYGVTPVIAKIARNKSHIIRIDLPGYESYQATVTHSVSGWVWGNVLFGGLIGLGVDALSGGLYKLTPEQITTTLSKKSVGVTTEGGVIYVCVALQPDPNWEKVGTLTPVQK